ANAAGFGDPHASAAVIADAVTLLSRNWNDLSSFSYPTNPASTSSPSAPLPYPLAYFGRPATNSNLRLAVCAGKNMNFSKASVAGADHSDLGTDGGVHNFLGLLENWGGRTLGYRGSLVGLYFSH